MSLSPKFVLMPSLQQVIFDKTLDTFLSSGEVRFFQDENRTIPKPVYTLVGTGPGSYTYVSLGSVLTLSGIGSFVDSSGGNIIPYLYPYEGLPTDPMPSNIIELYYIEVYSSTGVFQFDISAWPNLTANASPVNSSDTTDNILSNPEFIDVNFPKSSTISNPFVVNTSGVNVVTNIAPDWAVITNGTGAISLYQEIIIDQTAPGNPAYALGISTTGYTGNILLRQRLLTPRILAGSYASGTFIVEATNGGAYAVSMTITPSISGTVQTLCSGTTLSSNFELINSAAPILVNDPGGGSGYTDISIVFPVNAPLQISCVQLCGVADGTEVVDYLQQTPQREMDHLFHVFYPLLAFKPLPNLLTGWNFVLNPAQFGATKTGVAANPIYAWDQTIVQSAVGNLTITADSATDALSIVTTSNNEAFYMLQYLQGAEALMTTLDDLCINLNLYASAANVTVNVQLFYSSTNGIIPAPVAGNPGAFGSIVYSAGTPVFTPLISGWSKVQQFGSYYSTALVGSNFTNDTQFYGWNGRANYSSASSTQNFAIVVSFGVPNSGTKIIIESINLTQGDITTRPGAQQASDVLRECQYYYVKSFAPNTVPANNVGIGTGETLFFELVASVGPGTNFIPVRFSSPLRVAPVNLITLYNPGSGTAGQILDETGGNSYSASAITANTTSIYGFVAQGTAASSAIYNINGVHWTADARLGIV